MEEGEFKKGGPPNEDGSGFPAPYAILGREYKKQELITKVHEGFG